MSVLIVTPPDEILLTPPSPDPINEMFLENEIGGPARSSEACALRLRVSPPQPSSEQMSKESEEIEIPSA